MKKQSKEVNLFTFLNQIQFKNRKHPYDKKIANAWILTQWLSHDKDLINIVNDINKYLFVLPDEVIYEYFMKTVPKGKRYIKWTKKEKADEKVEKMIKKLQEKNPKLSIRECKMIISFLKNVKEKKK